MRISAKSEYACLALIELARSEVPGTPRRVKEIAQAQEIPERSLVQILLQLKSAGLVHSARGSDGGYQLARPADAIAVADVISAIEGLGDPPRKGGSQESRRLAALFQEARLAHYQILATSSIAQLAKPETSPDWVL